MKRRMLLILLSVIFIVFICISFNAIKTYNVNTIELKKQAKEYLFEKYSKQAVFESDPTYYDSVYFFNNVHFENEDTFFQVRYIVPALHFEDDFLAEPVKKQTE